MTANVSYPLAFLAGVVSFLSPCVLPLLPSYVTLITGLSFEDLTGQTSRAKVRYLTITNSLAFIGGFSFVFILLGGFSSYLGSLIIRFQEYVRIIGGILVIVFGLFVAGLLRLDFLMKEKKVHLKGHPTGYLGAFLIGMSFAAGWTPCIGPILGSILVVASTKGSAVYGISLLTVYSLGLALPFFLAALGFNTFLAYSRRLQRYMRVIMIVSGLILIAFGVLLLTNNVKALSNLMPNIGISL